MKKSLEGFKNKSEQVEKQAHLKIGHLRLSSLGSRQEKKSGQSHWNLWDTVKSVITWMLWVSQEKKKGAGTIFEEIIM